MSSSVKLYPHNSDGQAPPTSPLPQLINTPSGLAILELQGTINLPATESEDGIRTEEVSVGRIFFPDYNPNTLDPSNTTWMKRVHLYVGLHQRLTGEVKKLPKALAVIRKRGKTEDGDEEMTDATAGIKTEELEVVEIVKYKLAFSNRPEPVGATMGTAVGIT
ncbi:Ctf8-domain-containing protein [Pseudomassariella vexata]|uniref:Ctf8-domain-containing protein n=1 Tax=Pseudomassariella vexata TaxID=1141098 RepID=A0A1Y2DY26_9PEZI|nr:Ctf8-domain-containing protein [Pseudomassariella vexata]ORY64153.1 Ctf8-domain-containing protein [Pseudomassariella vexata]